MSLTPTTRPRRILRKTPRRYPTTAGDGSLSPLLADLRDALNLMDLWHATVALLDAALPNLHYFAALPCVEDRPIFVISTVPGRGYAFTAENIAPESDRRRFPPDHRH